MVQERKRAESVEEKEIEDASEGGLVSPHPRDMSVWPEIRCQRGHDSHASTLVDIDLAGPHRYYDCPQVPPTLIRRWKMFIWDPAIHPVDDLGIYCPAHDAVSETIVSHHIWEPRETVLAASALASSAPGAFFDFGAQIGWFTLLAASYGRTVHAIDADSDNLDLCAASVAVNEFSDRIHLHRARIGIDPFPVPPQHIRLAKIDVEGAENHVIELLRPALADGRIDHLLMEVSPVFADYYPALVASIIESGYDCFMLPPKHKPPLPLLPAATALAPYRLTATAALSLIPNMHQDDFWFARQGASW